MKERLGGSVGAWWGRIGDWLGGTGDSAVVLVERFVLFVCGLLFLNY